MWASRTRKHDSTGDDGDGAEYSKKKIKSDEDEIGKIVKRLESLITRVGEKTSSSLESKLEGLAAVLDADFADYKSKIISILNHCVMKMPEKMTTYSTLVGLLNAKNYTAGGEIIEALVKKLKENLRNCEFDYSLNIVRFLADLVNANVVVINSIFNLFENFLDVTLEEGIPQVRSDWYVYAILSSLPWVGKELSMKKDSELRKLLGKIDLYMSKRQKLHVPLLQVWTSNSVPEQEEYLDCLWTQIKRLRSDERRWTDGGVIHRPYLVFETELGEALQHNLPTIAPPIHNPQNRYPLPRIIFQLFEQTDVPEGQHWPKHHSIEKWLIQEDIFQIIHAYHTDRKACAGTILSYRVKGKIPLNYMIVECLFSQLFNLPSAPHIEVMYASLFIELCKLQPSSMPQVLAQATELLFERLDFMHTVCVDRFVNWFSHHLSNFQFKWSWEDWETCMEQNVDMPQPKFICETLIKCIRLSYHQRIIDMLPEGFASLLPPRTDPVFRFEFEEPVDPEEPDGTVKEKNESNNNHHDLSLTPAQILAKTLTEAFKRKDDANKIQMLLTDDAFAFSHADVVEMTSSGLVSTVEETVPVSYALLGPNTQAKIVVFTETILKYGHKSFSHSFSGIAKYFSIFKLLSETEEHQLTVLRSLYDLWRHNSQFITVLIDKMLKTQILNCSTVANWLFSDYMSQDFTRIYVWEIMNGCLRKMIKQVQSLEQDLVKARNQLERRQNQEDAMEEDAEDNADAEPVNVEDIEIMEEKLEVAQSDQKQLFLIIFQRFIIILSEYLVKCENENIDFNTPWYRSCRGRLQQIFMTVRLSITSNENYPNEINKYLSTLESLLFTNDIDPHILELFHQFCALKA